MRRNRQIQPQPAQRWLSLPLLFAIAALCALPVSSSPLPEEQLGITVIKENGRTIYVNDDVPRKPAKPGGPRSNQRSVLVYWSRTEKRWKPVRSATPGAMQAARSAAQEVSDYVAARPASETGPNGPSDPNYTSLARGRAVTAGEIDAAIEEAAQRHNVDANLVRAIIKVESNYNPRAISRKGALGLMQLMPGTARQLNVSNAFDPQQNVDAGVRHLKQLLNNFGGDVKLSLAAYNAGEGAVARNNGVPPYAETRNYVKRITELYGNDRWVGASSRPIRTWRGPDGVLHITNVE